MTNGMCTAVLRGHSSLVKGVTWDPIGSFIASQSDDKTVIIWRTSDWSLAHKAEGHWEKSVCCFLNFIIYCDQHALNAKLSYFPSSCSLVLHFLGDLHGHHADTTLLRLTASRNLGIQPLCLKEANGLLHLTF